MIFSNFTIRSELKLLLPSGIKVMYTSHTSKFYFSRNIHCLIFEVACYGPVRKQNQNERLSMADKVGVCYLGAVRQLNTLRTATGVRVWPDQ